MSSILFLVALITFGVVTFWYVFDEAAKGDGKTGFLAMLDTNGEAPPTKAKPSWRQGGEQPAWRSRRSQ